MKDIDDIIDPAGEIDEDELIEITEGPEMSGGFAAITATVGYCPITVSLMQCPGKY